MLVLSITLFCTPFLHLTHRRPHSQSGGAIGKNSKNVVLDTTQAKSSGSGGGGGDDEEQAPANPDEGMDQVQRCKYSWSGTSVQNIFPNLIITLHMTIKSHSVR